MKTSRETSPENKELFRELLVKLNRERAKFLYHKTQQDPDDIADYLNQEPATFEKLVQYWVVKDSVRLFVKLDPYIGVLALHQNLKRLSDSHRKMPVFIELFKKLFIDEIDEDGNWIRSETGSDGSDDFHADISLLRGIAMFSGNENRDMEGIKSRFLLALASSTVAQGMVVPPGIIIQMRDTEKREFEKMRRADISVEVDNSKDHNEELKKMVRQGVVGPEVLLLAHDAKKQMLKILKQVQTSKPNPEKNEINRLMMEYPRTGQILELLLTP